MAVSWSRKAKGPAAARGWCRHHPLHSAPRRLGSGSATPYLPCHQTRTAQAPGQDKATLPDLSPFLSRTTGGCWATRAVDTSDKAHRHSLQPPPSLMRSTHCVFWVEDVRSRGVVQDDSFPQVPSQAAEVLDIAALVEYTRLPEQASSEHPTAVQEICHRVSILEEREALA